MPHVNDSFGARSTLRVGRREYEIYRLDALARAGADVSRLPYSLRILLENLLRTEDGVSVTRDDVLALARWRGDAVPAREISFTPARVLLQDFTGVPAVVDLAAMRDAMAALGGDPAKINPLQPVELVIDHSVQVDAFASPEAFHVNERLDYERNRERYGFLKWGQRAFANFKVVPPNTGICHQVNLEYLARVVFGAGEPTPLGASGLPLAYPDSVVGTDSHTPMVNGLGVLGWGVGGIEAEATMLGQPITMLIPQVIGVRLEGRLPPGATATDLVLTVAEMLRRKGVVGTFVEFFGPGVASLALADRATIGNMTPEYGATATMFPVDQVTLDYLRFTGRPEERIELVEAYMRAQGLFHDAGGPEPEFSAVLRLDLAGVEPSIAGPRRPQDRIPLVRARAAFEQALPSLLPAGAAPAGTGRPPAAAAAGADAAARTGTAAGAGKAGAQGQSTAALTHGAVAIAAITSCTNTSNPSVMVAAGLLARKARERGLARKPWVKTSLAPGSRVVADYYARSGLQRDLDALGFDIVGYGCTTCIGNSGPLPPEVSEAIREGGLVVASVLSGNRNFEGRIHSEVRANYLMSPPLVVAFALAGRIDIDLAGEPLGIGSDGRPVMLAEVWPSREEIEAVMRDAISSQMYRDAYGKVYDGDERWRALEVAGGERYAWEEGSTYVRRPPYFDDMPREAPARVAEIRGARAIAVLGDSVTTDHISPAGSIGKDSPAGRYLLAHGVTARDFNSYGSRRGNHEVMVPGTFANVRIRNRLAPGTEGGFTTYLPTGEVTTIFEAAEKYRRDGTPLVVLAGKEYGSGSSRDWAAKGPSLQGIRAVIAESYERIHRSNLVGMGVLPLQFAAGDSVDTLGLDGRETFDIEGLSQAIADGFAHGREVKVRATRADGTRIEFTATIRIDTPQEVHYYRHGGILHYVLRHLLAGGAQPADPQPANAGAFPASPPQAVSRHDDGRAEEGSIESFPASDPPGY
ncbi:MAG: aconitate hydratase 1 [Burkholderiales bacterium 70-64]|nr:MAG: aconitate hydratase 1 [Burkholderiales bacterium 70-64]